MYDALELSARISIHALHEESDLTVRRYSSGHVISIHALHEESDIVKTQVFQRQIDFNPRSP